MLPKHERYRRERDSAHAPALNEFAGASRALRNYYVVFADAGTMARCGSGEYATRCRAGGGARCLP